MRRRQGAVAVVALVVAVGAVACGGDGDGPSARGEAIAEDAGCMACHSTGTEVKIGPGWGGIWGSDVELEDGRTVTVDDAYLRRSITDPGADVVAGFQLSMPRVPLSDEEIDALTAYLREISGGGS